MEKCKIRMSARLRPPEYHDTGWQYGFKPGQAPWHAKSSTFKTQWALVISSMVMVDGERSLEFKQNFELVQNELVARMLGKGEINEMVQTDCNLKLTQYNLNKLRI